MRLVRAARRHGASKRTVTPKATTVGWREWVALPDLGIVKIKAKVDTGAKSSAVHAFDISLFTAGENVRVRFLIQPDDAAAPPVAAEADLVGFRDVRSSNGGIETRPVVATVLSLAGRCIEIELTLTSRDEMGFRLLLGRQALRDQFLVDAGSSYLTGKPATTHPVAATPNDSTPTSATPQSATPRSATPQSATPQSAIPRSSTPSAAA